MLGRLAAGAAGYGMASSWSPPQAVVAVGAAAAGSELGRFHCDVVNIRVVVVEARGRSRRRHRGCRQRLGNVGGGPIDRWALRLTTGARRRQQPTDVTKERARSSARRRRPPHSAGQCTRWPISVAIRVEIVMGGTLCSPVVRLSRAAERVFMAERTPVPEWKPG